MPGTVVSVTRTTTEDFLKGLPELRAEDSVDDGVQCGVEVSEPEEEAEDMIIDAVFADGTEESQHEERKPTHYKGPGDDGQGFCCLLFPFFLERNMFLGLLFLGFSLLLLSGEQSALVSLAPGAGMLDWAVPDQQILCKLSDQISHIIITCVWGRCNVRGF